MQNKVTLAVLSAAVVGVGGIVANAIRNIADASGEHFRPSGKSQMSWRTP